MKGFATTAVVGWLLRLNSGASLLGASEAFSSFVPLLEGPNDEGNITTDQALRVAAVMGSSPLRPFREDGTILGRARLC